MLTVTLLAATLSILLALGILWANPHRFSNQTFAFTSIVQTLWLACVYRAIEAGDSLNKAASDELEFWFRANAVVISFLPTCIWLVKDAILVAENSRRLATIKSIPIFLVSIFSASLCFTDSFIRVDDTHLFKRGFAYYVAILLSIFVYFLCIIQVVQGIRKCSGIRRVELQFLALNAGSAALTIGVLNALGNYLNYRPLNRAGIVVLIAAYCLTAWALLFHRVFNAREVLMRLSQRGTFIFLIVGGTYGLWSLIHHVAGEPFGLLLGIAVCGLVAVWVEQGSKAWFESANRRKLADVRKAAIDLGNNEVQTDKLVSQFEGLLQFECNAESCTLLFDTGDFYSGSGLTMSKHSPGFISLVDEGWTTLESLNRRKPTSALEELKSFVEKHHLGLLIASPQGSPSPSVVVALGKRTDESPFTYPEIERLQILIALLDNLLARSRRAAHAALLARMEYLAVASRGLAHDLKNLITPVSSYLVHTDGLFPPDSPAGEVHATAKQATQTMSDYIRENLFFAEKMSPKFERFDLGVLLEEARDAALAAADARKVTIAVDDHSEHDFVADRVLLQRMLVNLLTNAIDASAPGGTVTTSAREGKPGWIRLEVSDEGTGIAKENLARVFDPYFTTKVFGDEMRGFGLGLTIAQKIVLLHHGEISVSSRAGEGTTFFIELPNVDETADRLVKASASFRLDSPSVAAI
jgi:signal transduction histidine kinase